MGNPLQGDLLLLRGNVNESFKWSWTSLVSGDGVSVDHGQSSISIPHLYWLDSPFRALALYPLVLGVHASPYKYFVNKEKKIIEN